MADSFTSYEIENDAAFKKQVGDAARLVGDLRVAFTLIAKDWRKSNRAQFTLKGAGQYPVLSPRYSARKKKDVGNKPILVRTGRLRDSITGQKNSDSIQEITKTSLTMGTTVKHGIYHQSDRARRVIPLRKFLFIGAEAPTTAPSIITGRSERFASIIAAETQRKLDRMK